MNLSTLGRRLSALASRVIPDPFVLALILSLLVFVLGLFFGESLRDKSMAEAALVLGQGWYGALWKTGLLKFAFQMCLVLVTGHAIALSRPAQWCIAQIVARAKSASMAVILVALAACLASLLQWGLGAIVGAFLAREMGRAFAERGQPVHYPLLGAAGYSGFMVWHGGLSGSAPTKVAEPGHFLESTIGIIDISQSLLGTLNLVVTGSLLLCIPLLCWLMMPRDREQMRGFEEFVPSQNPPEPEPDSDRDPAPKEERAAKRESSVEEESAIWLRLLEERAWLNRVIALAMFGQLAVMFSSSGIKAWNLDTVNLIFLALGLALHPSPRSYASAIADGVRGAAGIILQFPLYFGILGLLTSSGLIVQVSRAFGELASAQTLPLWTFLSAGLVNFFVPSGGGQWVVQGPIMMEAAVQLGASPVKVLMALSYGDAWTNMLQPFWALPLLGIMNLRARDIVGYTALIWLLTGPLILLWLWVL